MSTEDKKPSNTHQLHIEIPLELHEKLKKIIPEKGLITSTIRRFLQRYVSEFEHLPSDKSPFDKATDGVIDKDIRRMK